MRIRGYAIALAGLILVGAGCYGGGSADLNVPAQGRAVFTVSDATTALTGVTAVNVTVGKVEAHMTDRDWVTVSSASKTYDLLRLKASGSAELLADANLAAGTYDQIRLDISKVELTVNGKVQAATLPSSMLRIVGKLTVAAGQTATAELDFMVDRSLHVTGSGTYVLSPVVRLVTRTGATVSIGADGKVGIGGGKTETDEEVGMDENGETKAGFELNGDLEIDASGMVHMKSSTTTTTQPEQRPASGDASTIAVEIKGFAFLPAAVTVSQGGKVVFTNDDAAPHTVTADDGSFSSPTIAAGTKYTLDASGIAIGVHAFHCSIHPSMHGTLIVK